jgi:hypothetical protein
MLGGSVAAVALLAAGLTAAPVTIGDDLAVVNSAALAKGGGNGGGNDGGNANGHGAGGNGGHGNSAVAGNQGQGNGLARGQSTTSSVTAETDDEETKANRAALASKLGNLNAAHASATAFANASPNSMVGSIAAAYGQESVKGAVTADQASVSLEDISNKPVDEEVIAAVDALVDGKIAGPDVEDDQQASVEGETPGETVETETAVTEDTPVETEPGETADAEDVAETTEQQG